MRTAFLTLSLLVVGCAKLSSNRYLPPQALEEIERVLAYVGRPYAIQGTGIVETGDPLLKELVAKYENDHVALDCAFDKGGRDARIFALHAMSNSDVFGFETIYGRWLDRLAKEGHPDLQGAALWYSFSFNERVVIAPETAVTLLNAADQRVTEQTLLALRNGAVVPQFDAAGETARRLFEAITPHLKHPGDGAQFAQETLQAMTTVERRRGYRFLERDPLPPAGPMHEPAWRDRNGCFEAWRLWWTEHRDYLVWVPPRFILPEKPQLMNGKTAIRHALNKVLHTGKRLGGGFFLLDSDAKRAGMPTQAFRLQNPWKEGEGPLDPRLYEPAAR